MKVFIVYFPEDYHPGGEVLGVFSTRELADEFHIVVSLLLQSNL